MKTLIAHLFIGFKVLLVMTVLTGILYPLFIWGYANSVIKQKANGSFIEKNNVVRGSELIGQKFTQPNYFWSRPSAVDSNSSSSGATNLSPTSADLKKQVTERRAFLTARHQGEPPQDLLFASGSGLDPHISLESAEYQLQRVAIARGLDITTLRHLVQSLTEKPQYGILGEARINVLKLNLALDN